MIKAYTIDYEFELWIDWLEYDTDLPQIQFRTSPRETPMFLSVAYNNANSALFQVCKIYAPLFTNQNIVNVHSQGMVLRGCVQKLKSFLDLSQYHLCIIAGKNDAVLKNCICKNHISFAILVKIWMIVAHTENNEWNFKKRAMNKIMWL